VAVGEEDEGVAGCAIRRKSAEFVMEQPAEGPGAGSNRLPEFGQRCVIGGALVQRPGNALQPAVGMGRPVLQTVPSGHRNTR